MWKFIYFGLNTKNRRIGKLNKKWGLKGFSYTESNDFPSGLFPFPFRFIYSNLNSRYALTNVFPNDQLYSLIDQIGRETVPPFPLLKNPSWLSVSKLYILVLFLFRRWCINYKIFSRILFTSLQVRMPTWNKIEQITSQPVSSVCSISKFFFLHPTSSYAMFAFGFRPTHIFSSISRKTIVLHRVKKKVFELPIIICLSPKFYRFDCYKLYLTSNIFLRSYINWKYLKTFFLLRQKTFFFVGVTLNTNDLIFFSHAFTIILKNLFYTNSIMQGFIYTHSMEPKIIGIYYGI